MEFLVTDNSVPLYPVSLDKVRRDLSLVRLPFDEGYGGVGGMCVGYLTVS